MVFPAQLASPKSKENANVRAVAFDVVVTMWTLDWLAVLGIPSKLLIGQISIFHVTNVQDKRQRRGKCHNFSKLDKNCMLYS